MSLDSLSSTQRGAARAAFHLGRNPYLVRLWQRFAIDEAGLGSQQEFPCSVYPVVGQIHEFPDPLFHVVDGALHELAVAGSLTPTILIEIRRRLDRLELGCREMYRLLRQNTQDSVSKTFWELGWDYDRLTELLDHVLPSNSDLTAWKDLGVLIGSGYMDVYLFTLWPWRLESLGSLVSSELQELQVHVDLLRQLDLKADPAWRVHGIEAPGWSLFEEVKETLKKLDDAAVRLLDTVEPDAPLIVINEQARCLTFLGEELRFSAFKARARGGLKCYIELARSPQTEVSYSDLTERAGLTVEPERLREYFSGFWKELSGPAKRFSSDPRSQHFDTRLIMRGFVENRRSQYRKGVEGTYCLAVGERWVQFV